MSRRHAAGAGCVLTITALALAAVPAGADRGRSAPPGPATPVVSTASAVDPPPVGPVVSTTSAVDPPSAMLGAIQRDLNLSPTQASARLANEARLLPVAARLRQSLGATFAGAWLRPKIAHTLVVATTSTADIPKIIAAGAQAEVVPESLTKLLEVKEKLDETLPPTPLTSSVRYVDVKRNKVVVLTAEPVQAENFVTSSGVDHHSVLVLPSDEIPTPLYDLVGGNAYYVGVTSRCSIGFSVHKGTRPGFVSAGHCGKTGSATSGFNRIAQGTFEGSVFPGSDYAWISVNKDWRPVAEVDNDEGGTVPVAGSVPAIEGASVCRSGSTTDWHCGLIRQRNASVTYPQGTVDELVRTSVCAEPGDSGGSFISGDQAQGVTSGGSGDCSQGGTTYYQPIGEILSVYGLTLVTTANSPPSPSETCTGYPNTYKGTLAAGQSLYQPMRSYYRSTRSGVHSACLNGPNGSDFDLYLQKWDSNRGAWAVVATSEGPGSGATINYTGTAGYYRYRVTASVGSGPYVLGLRVP